MVEAAPVSVKLDDLHIWRVSHQKYACIMSVSQHADADESARRRLSPAYFHRLLAGERRIVHLTVEIRGAETA